MFARFGKRPVQIIDANVLLYAVNGDSAQHERANRWLRTSVVGNEVIDFPWLRLLAFVRLSTNPRIFRSSSFRRMRTGRCLT